MKRKQNKICKSTKFAFGYRYNGNGYYSYVEWCEACGAIKGAVEERLGFIPPKGMKVYKEKE